MRKGEINIERLTEGFGFAASNRGSWQSAFGQLRDPLEGLERKSYLQQLQQDRPMAQGFLICTNDLEFI